MPAYDDVGVPRWVEVFELGGEITWPLFSSAKQSQDDMKPVTSFDVELLPHCW